ncbi:iron-containing alcohol dehydrogenase, partial [Cribrihabitans sp. XS_ASV171]
MAAAHPGPVALVHGSSAGWAAEAAERFRKQGRAVHAVLSEGEPTLDRLEAALARLRPDRPVLVVAIGGGAAIDLGKALAALLPAPGAPLDYLEIVGKGEKLDRAPFPFIAIPTTAGTGAEATKNAVIGVPAEGRKVSLRDPRMTPVAALMDAELTDNAPWSVTFASGMDAVTQLIEPYVSARATPQTDALCRAAIGPALRALVTLSQREDPAQREV